MEGLSQRKVELNKQEIIRLLRSTGRDGVDNLIAYLEKHDYFTAPASTKYHLSVRGGLAQHSLNVYYNLMQIYYGDNWRSLAKYAPCAGDVYHENIIIVALLHDLCKVDFYQLKNGYQKDSSGKWIEVQQYVVNEQVPILGHGTKSVVIAQQFIRLYVDEIQAISFHMGLQDFDRAYSSTISGVYVDCRLALFTHLADSRASFVEDYDCLKNQDSADDSLEVDDLPF